MVKNNSIWLWRIVFTYAIAIYHLNNSYGIITGWYIGVEFFFIVSGVLLANRVGADEQITPWKYTLQRAMEFFQICLLNGILRLGYDVYMSGETVRDFLWQLFEALPDVFMIYLFGGSESLNPVIWYINALLAGGCVVIYLLRYHERFYLNIVAPFAILLIYGWCVKFSGCMEGFAANNSEYLSISNYLFLLRGFAGLSLGVLVKRGGNKCLPVYRKKCELLCKGIEIAGYVLVMAMAFWHGRTRADFVYAFLLALCVGLSFTNSISERIVHNLVIQCLNKLSVYIYLCHNVIRYICVDIKVNYGMATVLGYCVAVTLLALLEYVFLKCLKKSWRRLKQGETNESINDGCR